MKKIFTTAAIIALTGLLTASAAESMLENFVLDKLSPITNKEKEFNSKMEAQQKENEAKRARYEREQRQRQAAYERQQREKQRQIEKQRREAQERRQATRDAIKAEKDYWKSLTK